MAMTFYLSLLFIFVAAGFAITVWQIRRKQPSDNEALLLLQNTLEKLQKDVQDGREKDREHLQQRIDTVQNAMTSGMQKSSDTMQKHFNDALNIVKDVTGKLTELEKTNKQVVNFSEQLQDLQSILKNPKGKGVLSEYWLETMLAHVLQPEQYQMQYKFSNGEIVDAVVFFQETVIPIDAKFSSAKYLDIAKESDPKKRESIENSFKNDLKARIDETAKYIRPSEKTTDFAFMFLPAEGIYYDLLINKVGSIDVNRQNLIEYAFSKRVVIVSPTTFFAYLQTVLQGLKAFKMEESVGAILKQVESLGKHLGSYDSFMQKVGNHLGTTVSMYNQAYGEFKKIDKDILKLTEGKEGGTIDIKQLEKPSAHIEQAFDSASKKKMEEVEV